MSLAIGQTLNHYRILRQIGAGGMGEVYEAEDTKLGRKVALKVLPEETASDPQRQERFEREAKAVAALNHPSIVTIYSVEQAAGVHFITMELVEGETLRRMLPRGGLPLGRLLDLSIPLAEALAAAHQHGITHRDLKPENILVSRDGKVKVLDFGLAKMEGFFGAAGGQSHLPTRALTEEGRIVGTVAYMSPEQGEGKRVDPRSDVFTLGIILYEMSTGERPFKGDTAVSLLSSILKDHPPPVTAINVTLPRDLSRIVDRCLMKDPARRFQSAMGLATELATLKQDSDSGELAAISVSGRRSGDLAAPKAMAAGGMKGIKYAVAAAVVVALAAAGFMALRGWRGGSPQPTSDPSASGQTGSGASPGGVQQGDRQRIVVLPFENLGAPEDAYFAAGMTEEITSRLASVGGLGVISRTSSVQYAKTTKTTKQIGAELDVDYVLEGSVRWERGAGKASRVRVTPQLIRVADDTHLWADRYDREMKDVFAVQSEIAEQVVQKLGLAMGQPERQAPGGGQPTTNLDAYQIYLRGKALFDSPASDADAEKKAIGMMEQAVQLDPKFAVAWATLSQSHSSLYHFRVAYTEERLAKARECADRALALQPGLREGHLALGYYYYWGRNDYAQALEELQRAAGGRDDDSEILESMGYVMRRQGRWDESIAMLEKAFALNPRNPALAEGIVDSYRMMRRYPEALRFSDIAISLAQGAFGYRIGRIFLQVEMDGNTRAAWETVKGIDRRTFPPLPGIESALHELDGRFKESLAALSEWSQDVLDIEIHYIPKPLFVGMDYLAMNDRARAQAACESARQVLEKAIAGSPRDARMRLSLGKALACLGRKDEAVREARLAADITPVSNDAIDGPFYQEGLAMVYAMVGESDAALDILEKNLSFPSGTSVNLLKLDPVWKPLWKLPRFQKLMEKYG